MSFRTIVALVSSVIAPLSIPQALGAGDQEIQIIKATLEKQFPGVEIESVAPAPWEGLYEVVTEGEIVYTNKDAKLLFSGQILDTATKQNLTKRSWNEHHRIDFASLPLDQAIKIVKGNGARKLAVFEDPMCPFCAELEKELKEVDDITMYVFLLPLEDIHPGATEVAEKIWCSKDRAVAWKSWMQDHQANNDVCESDVVNQVRSLANKLKINSTPTMFFESGYRNSGALAAKELEQLFKSPG